MVENDNITNYENSKFGFRENTWCTLESGIDVLGQGINAGPGKLDKNNKHRALNKRRAWKI